MLFTPKKNALAASESPAASRCENRLIAVSSTGNANMHYFHFTSPSAPARLVRLTVCALLPAFIHESAASDMQRSALPSTRSQRLPSRSLPEPYPKSVPYLVVSMPPPLRFAETVEPTDPISGQAAVLGPPHPGGLLEEIAALNQQAAISVSAPTSADGTISSMPPEFAASTEPHAEPTVTNTTTITTTETTSSQPGVSIIPDDTPRAIRAEDVLVYFQFPGASSPDRTPPRSSATYQQK